MLINNEVYSLMDNLNKKNSFYLNINQNPLKLYTLNLNILFILKKNIELKSYLSQKLTLFYVKLFEIKS